MTAATNRIVISGASGSLAGLVIAELVKHVPAQSLVLATRNPDALSHWAAQGAQVVYADYADPASLRQAYQGGDRLLLISGLAIGERVAQHAAALDAARECGVRHVTYTSVGGVHPASPTPSAAEHVATERLLWASGLSFAALRNQLYAELVYPMVCDSAVPGGRWVHMGEHGHLCPVSRHDVAACAAAILLNPDAHDRVAYEITGPQRYTLHEVAALVADVVGQPIEYVPVTEAQMYAMFDALGVPRHGQPKADFIPARFGSNELVQNLVAIEAGYHDILTHHVQYLTGRPPRPLSQVLAEVHHSHGAAGHGA